MSSYYVLPETYTSGNCVREERRRKSKKADMASVVMGSLSLKGTPLRVEKAAVGLPRLSRSSFKVVASGGKKIKTDKPFGTGGGMTLRDGLDASGRKGKVRLLLQHHHPFISTQKLCSVLLNSFYCSLQGKGVYQFVDKYGANVDGYRYIT